MTWKHIRKFRDFWPRKLIVKSVMRGVSEIARHIFTHRVPGTDSAAAPVTIAPEAPALRVASR